MRKDPLQSGAHSLIRVAGVSLDPGKVCAVRRLGLTLGLALDVWTGWDLKDLQQEKPILMVGNWSGADSKLTHMRCMKNAHRRKFHKVLSLCMKKSGMVPMNAELGVMKSVVLVSRVDHRKSFITKWKEIHNNFSKLGS